MSQGRSFPHAEALATALRIVRDLRPACERIEIAGSVRRGKPEVHDIEIVVAPRWESRSIGDLWCTPVEVDVFEEHLAGLIDSGALRPRAVVIHRANGSVEEGSRLGTAYKALETGTAVPVDLFVVRPPAQWGVIYALRTGPGRWNTKLVTDCKAISRRVRAGQVEAWRGGVGRWEPVPTPEEEDFFRELGQPWVEPAARDVALVRIQRAIAEGAA